MGWYISKNQKCPKCQSKKCIIWDRPGECKLITCGGCGLFASYRPTHIVESSFIIDDLKGKSEEDIDVMDLLYDQEELQNKNQNIIPKDSEW